MYFFFCKHFSFQNSSIRSLYSCIVFGRTFYLVDTLETFFFDIPKYFFLTRQKKLPKTKKRGKTTISSFIISFLCRILGYYGNSEKTRTILLCSKYRFSLAINRCTQMQIKFLSIGISPQLPTNISDPPTMQSMYAFFFLFFPPPCKF